MVFNPVFFDNANGNNELNFFAKPQKISASNYLFANILNVYTSDIASVNKIGEGAKEKSSEITSLIENIFGLKIQGKAQSFEKVISEEQYVKLTELISEFIGTEGETKKSLTEIEEESGKAFALSDERQMLMLFAQREKEGVKISAFAANKNDAEVQSSLAEFIKSISEGKLSLNKLFEKQNNAGSKVKVFELSSKIEKATEFFDEKSWGDFDVESAKRNVARAIEKENVKKETEFKEAGGSLENVLAAIGIFGGSEEINKILERGNIEEIKKIIAGMEEKKAGLEKQFEIVAKSLDKLEAIAEKITENKISEKGAALLAGVRKELGKIIGTGKTAINLKKSFAALENKIKSISNAIEKINLKRNVYRTTVNAIKSNFENIEREFGTIAGATGKENPEIKVFGEKLKNLGNAISELSENKSFSSKTEIPKIKIARLQVRQLTNELQSLREKVFEKEQIVSRTASEGNALGKVKEAINKLARVEAIYTEAENEAEINSQIEKVARELKAIKNELKQSAISFEKVMRQTNKIIEANAFPESDKAKKSKKKNGINSGTVAGKKSVTDIKEKISLHNTEKKSSNTKIENRKEENNGNAKDFVFTEKNEKEFSELPNKGISRGFTLLENNLSKETVKVPIIHKNEIIKRLANFIQKKERTSIEFQLNPEHLHNTEKKSSDTKIENRKEENNGGVKDFVFTEKNEKEFSELPKKGISRGFTLLENHLSKETVKLPVIHKNEIIKRLANFIQKKERTSIEFQLNPEHLGKVKVALDLLHHDIVKANISVETHHAKALMENNLNELVAQLNKNGIQFSEVNINLTQNWQKQDKNSKMFGKANKKYLSNKSAGEVEEIIETEQSEPRMFGYNTYEFLA